MRTDWWFFPGNGTGLTCLGPGLTASAVIGVVQGIGNQHSALSLSLGTILRCQPVTSLPRYAVTRLAGREEADWCPLAPLGEGHCGPGLRRAVGSRSKASRGLDQPASTPTSTHSTQIPRRCSCEGLWASPAHPDNSQTSLPGQVGPCFSILFDFSCIPIGSAQARYL